MKVEQIFIKIVEMLFNSVELLEGLAPLLLSKEGLSGLQLIPMNDNNTRKLYHTHGKISSAMLDQLHCRS